MIRILHGENLAHSRQALVTHIEGAKAQGLQVARLEAKQLDLPILENAFGSTSLFGEEKIVVIEELHSLPKSKRKDELIDYIASVSPNSELILWEKRPLTATMLKKFPSAQSQEFKVTNELFKWLDSLDGKKNSPQRKQMLTLLQKAAQQNDEFMCFSMLIRQVRLLIQAQEGTLDGVAPFIATKLQKQTQSFTLEQLLRVHHHLLEIDLRQKTSQSALGLLKDLELLMIEM